MNKKQIEEIKLIRHEFIFNYCEQFGPHKLLYHLFFHPHKFGGYLVNYVYNWNGMNLEDVYK